MPGSTSCEKTSLYLSVQKNAFSHPAIQPKFTGAFCAVFFLHYMHGMFSVIFFSQQGKNPFSTHKWIEGQLNCMHVSGAHSISSDAKSQLPYLSCLLTADESVRVYFWRSCRHRIPAPCEPSSWQDHMDHRDHRDHRDPTSNRRKVAR